MELSYKLNFNKRKEIFFYCGSSGVSSVFSSILSNTDDDGSISPLDIIVRDKLQIINNVATMAVSYTHLTLPTIYSV